MKTQISLFGRSIPQRLFLMNLMMLGVFIIIVFAAFFAFNRVKGILRTEFSDSIGKISGNAETGRKITEILTETNLLMGVFYGKEELLKTKGPHIVQMSDALTSETDNPQLRDSLGSFSQKIKSVLQDCEKIVLIRQKMDAAETEFHGTLDPLNQNIADKILGLAMEGKNTSMMEQVTFMVSGYRETFTQAAYYFAKTGIARSKDSGESVRRFFALTDDLLLRLKTLTASDPEIAEYGRQLIALTEKYKEAAGQFHGIVAEFNTKKDSLKEDENRLLGLMTESDRQIALQSEKKC